MNLYASTLASPMTISSSGPVVKLVLFILIAFSVVTWAIILVKVFQVRKAKKQTEKFLELFWEIRNLEKIFDLSLDFRWSPVAEVFKAGYRELRKIKNSTMDDTVGFDGEGKHRGKAGLENIERALKKSAIDETVRLERYHTFLATVASSSPFIGLFGTVWGIMNAFEGIGRLGSASLAVVAPGIAEALIATATGLAAAIPAVIAYNYFSRETEVLEMQLDNFILEFLNICERYFV